jgi:hypothetical protein
MVSSESIPVGPGSDCRCAFLQLRLAESCACLSCKSLCVDTLVSAGSASVGLIVLVTTLCPAASCWLCPAGMSLFCTGYT